MTRSDSVSVGYVAGLLLVLCVSFFVGLGGVPLFDEDEGAYAEVTREMRLNGDYITPQLNGKPFFHKPPMIYWVQSVSVTLFGLNEFAFRLPSAIASTLWAAAMFFFCRRFLSASVGWYAVVFLVTTLQASIIAKAAIADALLNLFVSATLFAAYSYYTEARIGRICMVYLFAALGVLAKGPIAVVIPLATCGLFFASKRKWRLLVQGLINPLGWAIFLAVALPWYVALYLQHGPEFINEIFFVHNVQRFSSSFEGHSGSVFYYLPVIVIGMLPHTAYLLKAVYCWRSWWQDDCNRFLLIWFGFVFVFFSIAGTKLHHYVVYGYTPLFIFMAQCTAKIRHWLLVAIWPLGFVLALFFLPELAQSIAPFVKDEFARLVISGAMTELDPAYRLMVAASGAGLLVLAVVRSIPRRLFVILTGAVFIFLVNWTIMPRVANVMQQPVKEAALMAAQRGYDVVMWRMRYHTFNLYQRKIAARRRPLPGDIVITKATKLAAVRRHEVLYSKHGIVMTRIIEIDPK